MRDSARFLFIIKSAILLDNKEHKDGNYVRSSASDKYFMSRRLHRLQRVYSGKLIKLRLIPAREARAKNMLLFPLELRRSLKLLEKIRKIQIFGQSLVLTENKFNRLRIKKSGNPSRALNANVQFFEQCATPFSSRNDYQNCSIPRGNSQNSRNVRQIRERSRHAAVEKIA